MTHTIPIDDSAIPLLDELGRALLLGERMRPRDRLARAGVGAAPDLLLGIVDTTRSLQERVGGEALGLLLHVMERPGAPSPEELPRMAEGLGEATAAALRGLEEELGPSVSRALVGLVGAGQPLSAEERNLALQSVAWLLAEVGLEHLEHDIELVGQEDGRLAIRAAPVSSLAAHARLWGRIFERAEALLPGNPLLGFERLASLWWFGTYSSADSPEEEGPQTIREHEWSLVDRHTLHVRRPMLDLFMKTELAASMGDKQRKVAEALQASFPGVFIVRERTGDSAVFQELTRGREIQVAEYAPELGYDKGWIGFGRVCAFDGPIHLRSPGTVFLESNEKEISRIRDSLSGELRALPPAIRVEILLSVLGGTKEIPLSVPPSDTPVEAKEILTALTSELEKAGLAEEVPPEEVGEEVTRQAQASGVREIAFQRFHVDPALKAWMRALLEYSRSGAAPKMRAKRPKRARKGKKPRGN